MKDVDTLHALVAGGCHVGGYPVPPGKGFVSTMAALLLDSGLKCEPTTIEHVKLTRPERVVEIARRKPWDVAIFQCGHFELSFSLVSQIRRGGTSNSFERPASRLRPGSLTWTLHSWAKVLVDRLMGHRIVDVEAFEMQLSSFFDTVSATLNCPVIVLSPLPCASPVLMSYRREVIPIYRREAQRRGFSFLEVLDMTGASADRFTYFADDCHLGLRGHRQLGEVIAHAVVDVIQSSNRASKADVRS